MIVLLSHKLREEKELLLFADQNILDTATRDCAWQKIKTQKQTWNDSTFKSQITRGKRTVAVCWSEYFRYCNKSVRLRKRLNCVSELLSVLWRYLLGGRKGIRPVKNEWSGAGVVVWSEMQTCIWPSWCHCHAQSLASVKSRLVLPFWYRLTRVVLEKGPLMGVCV